MRQSETDIEILAIDVSPSGELSMWRGDFSGRMAVEDLVKKGELTVEQGKVLNEELKHNVAEKLRKPVSVETVEKDLQNMDVEDLETLKAKIEELQKAKKKYWVKQIGKIQEY